MTPIRGWTRETRLLVITVVLSVGVLLALARLRFPGQEPAARLALPARPLQQIVERASFDDLTNAVSRAASRIRPALVVVSLQPGEDPPQSRSLVDSLEPEQAIPSRALAVYTGNDRWAAVGPAASHIRGKVVPSELSLAGRDPIRTLLVFTGHAPEGGPVATSRPTLPAFLVLAEPTAAGVAVRPLFVAATESAPESRWRTPVWPLAPSAASPGTLVFSLEGAFVGGVVRSRDGLVLVPADAIVNAAEHADRDRTPWSIGIRLQRMDAGLAGALGSSQGVVVTEVDAAGPAAGGLLTGDVITELDGGAATDPDDVLLRIGASDPAAGVDLEIVRNGTPASVHVAGHDDARVAGSPAPAAGSVTRPAEASIGARFAASPRGSRVERVDRDGPAARAGLVPGDEVWWIQGAPAASPGAIARRWRTLPPGGRLAIGVNPAEPRLLSIGRP